MIFFFLTTCLILSGEILLKIKDFFSLNRLRFQLNTEINSYLVLEIVLTGIKGLRELVDDN